MSNEVLVNLCKAVYNYPNKLAGGKKVLSDKCKFYLNC